MKRVELKEKSQRHTTGRLMMRVYENFVGFPLHWHDEYEILRIISGSGGFMVNGKYYDIDRSCVLFINPGELHSLISHSEQFVSYSVVVHPYLIFGNDCTHLLDQKRIFPRKIDNETVVNELDRLYEAGKKRENGFELELKSAVLRVFSELYKSDEPVEDVHDADEMIRLENIFDFVHNNYDKKMTLEHLCEASNYSKSYIIRLFRQYTGKTPIEYINDYRVVRAKDMLNGGNTSILEISNACGFTDVNYFIRTFKKITGTTPHKYRLSKNK